ncbi:zinc finger translocation-associated protein-like [Hyla sarda]|uniref:zinc finger translocation-associated protein-like n=1 Tax=Hyla sarda TaxID=327740 RepID=UPI0024C3D792|nr:zinc finger translocation-associated protein-like [Hyla sarda]XP_056388390.1 zinc finger translocation-associated protein-like [Hyla sarda]
MVGSNFSESEERVLICRFLEKGYDQTRSQIVKKDIVRSLMRELRRKHGGRHDRMAVLKKWSDLKRRHMDRVRQIRDQYHPGATLATVRPKRTRRQAEAEEEEEEEGIILEEEEEGIILEEETQEQEEEQPGPSHMAQAIPPPPPPAAPQEGEEGNSSPLSSQDVAYTPNQEIAQQLKKEIKKIKKDHEKMRKDMMRMARKITGLEELINKLT